jgi:hypothetical protein
MRTAIVIAALSIFTVSVGLAGLSEAHAAKASVKASVNASIAQSSASALQQNPGTFVMARPLAMMKF